MVRYKFAALCLIQSLLHRGALFIAQDINSRASGLDLARELDQLFPILFRPGAHTF